MQGTSRSVIMVNSITGFVTPQMHALDYALILLGYMKLDTHYSEAAVNTLPVGSASAFLRLTLLNNEYPFLSTY